MDKTFFSFDHLVPDLGLGYLLGLISSLVSGMVESQIGS